jgi:formate dehydrogenase subunit delta
MDIGNLIRMANRIGDFFGAACPDPAEAAAGVAGHIAKFWEPRMRAALLDFLARHPDGLGEHEQLSSLVCDAVAARRERWAPKQRGLSS